MRKRIVHDNSNNKLTKKLKNQIPTEYNQERTLRIIRKQNEIPGESRTKTLNDLITAVEIGQLLKDLSFPVEKKIILTYVQDLRTTNPKANQILPQLLNLKDNKQYRNMFDITSELGIVE
ncbi:MAG: hypothetical protein ACRD8W_09195 [Nitrososphaeraceae archaeon]